MELKQQIQSKGLKLSWVAQQVGISKTMFSFYLSGTRTMPDDVKQKVKAIIS